MSTTTTQTASTADLTFLTTAPFLHNPYLRKIYTIPAHSINRFGLSPRSSRFVSKPTSARELLHKLWTNLPPNISTFSALFVWVAFFCGLVACLAALAAFGTLVWLFWASDNSERLMMSAILVGIGFTCVGFVGFAVDFEDKSLSHDEIGWEKDGKRKEEEDGLWKRCGLQPLTRREVNWVMIWMFLRERLDLTSAVLRLVNDLTVPRPRTTRRARQTRLGKERVRDLRDEDSSSDYGLFD